MSDKSSYCVGMLFEFCFPLEKLPPRSAEAMSDGVIGS